MSERVSNERVEHLAEYAETRMAQDVCLDLLDARRERDEKEAEIATRHARAVDLADRLRATREQLAAANRALLEVMDRVFTTHGGCPWELTPETFEAVQRLRAARAAEGEKK